jgi:hypothetical protein
MKPEAEATTQLEWSVEIAGKLGAKERDPMSESATPESGC